MQCPTCQGPCTEDGTCPQCSPQALRATVVKIDKVMIDGRIEIGKLLGQGGMGQVYEGYDHALSRHVAIKCLHEDLINNKELAARFYREAQALAKIEHRCVVPIYHVGEHQGRPYFLMRLLKGVTLADLIHDRGKLPLPEVAYVGNEILEALAVIHESGCVHRDIKPANIMLGDTGECTLLDFGIMRSSDTRMTRTGITMGSPYFMAPEQGRDSRLADARSDLYAFGATLYCALTGMPPFEGDSEFEIITKHNTAPLVPPSEYLSGLPAGLDDFFRKTLAKEPGDRFPSSEDMRAALVALTPLDIPQVGARLARRVTAKVMFHRRRRWPIAVMAALAVALLGGLTVSQFLSPTGAITAAPSPPAAAVPVATPDAAKPATAEIATVPPPSTAAPVAAPTSRTGAKNRRQADTGTATLRVVTLEHGLATWARIAIDGKDVGTSPIANYSVPSGRHVIVAQRPGYKVSQRLVTVQAHQNEHISLELQRDAP